MKKNLLFIPILFIFGFMSCKQDVGITYPIQRQILTEDESSSSLAARGFSTDKPIQASFNSNGKLVITSYAPTLVKDVEIYNGDKLITKIKELAGFSEIILDINKPAELTSLIVKSEDPFMKKIGTIKYPLNIKFSQTNENVWAPMPAKVCRQASIVAITMSYMFNHKDYPKFLEDWNKGEYKGKEVINKTIPIFPIVFMEANPFKDDKGNIIEASRVLEQARGIKDLNLAIIKVDEPAGGIGGGNFLGVREYLYDNFTRVEKINYMAQNQKDAQCYTVDAFFHEFGHVMGYMHQNKNPPGTMHYHGGWTNANYRFLLKLIGDNDLPIPLDGTWEQNLGFPAKL